MRWGARTRVLLVDDHPAVRAAIRQTLELHGEVDVVGEAAGGAEALDMTSRLRPDAVVMDHRMRDMDGASATRAIVARWPTTRVIAFSSAGDPSAVAAMLGAGASAYVVKGDPPSLLLAALARPR